METNIPGATKSRGFYKLHCMFVLRQMIFGGSRKKAFGRENVLCQKVSLAVGGGTKDGERRGVGHRRGLPAWCKQLPTVMWKNTKSVGVAWAPVFF